MTKVLTAPSKAIVDLTELDLFFEVWKQALGPPNANANGTEAWLHGFGGQTKWLTGDSWEWWLRQFHPPDHLDMPTVENFISLVIGMLGSRTNPQGDAVRYARQVVTFVESQNN